MRKSLRLFVCGVAVVVGFGLVAAQPALATKKQCWCVTPKKKTGRATGKDKRGRPSKHTIRWGNPPYSGFTIMYNPMAGQSPTDVATALGALLAAKGLHVCPVVTNPNGQALICVTEMAPNVGGTSSSSTDTAFNSMTWLTKMFPVTVAMKAVAGTFKSSEIAAGGKFSIQPIVADADGNETTLSATVTTFPGQTGDSVSRTLLNSLADMGFEVSETTYDFGDGAGLVPAIDIQPGIYTQIIGLGETTEDAAFSDLRASDEMLIFDVPVLDLNSDGSINTEDFKIFVRLLHDQRPEADMDRNGVVDRRDMTAFLAAMSEIEEMGEGRHEPFEN